MKQVQTQQTDNLVSQLIINGDLGRLSPNEKVTYYNGYCQRLGLDPFTKPFDLLRLNGREILYCTRSGAQQLNKLHNVSHAITSRETNADAGVYLVTSRACLPDGRCTESIGAVNIQGLKGEAYANAIMKAETKAKRRATLDLLGLGVLDESEMDTLPVVGGFEVKAEVMSEADLSSRTTYKTEGEVVGALDLVETMAHLKSLYKMNSVIVDGNPEIKEMFSSLKKELPNGK